MFRFKELVEAHMDELAHTLSSEHGKVIADSRGDIQRGLEVIEFACGIPHVLKGEYTQGALVVDHSPAGILPLSQFAPDQRANNRPDHAFTFSEIVSPRIATPFSTPQPTA